MTEKYSKNIVNEDDTLDSWEELDEIEDKKNLKLKEAEDKKQKELELFEAEQEKNRIQEEIRRTNLSEQERKKEDFIKNQPIIQKEFTILFEDFKQANSNFIITLNKEIATEKKKINIARV